MTSLFGPLYLEFSELVFVSGLIVFSLVLFCMTNVSLSDFIILIELR